MSLKKAHRKLTNWPGGGLTDLAETAAMVLDGLDKQDDTLASANDLSKRIRVIRDYAQRGILSAAKRQGKELFYKKHHLSQLVAARLLADEGVTLAAIASQFQQDPDVVMMTLGMTPPQDNIALAKWNAMERRDRPRGTLRPVLESTATFLRSTSESRGRRMELRQSLDRLGVQKDYPKINETTRVDITQWCTVLLDSAKLRKLSRSELEDLGRALTASLMKTRSTKGGS